MVALHRAGRSADALAAYQSARRRFAEELGLEPVTAAARARAADPRPRSRARPRAVDSPSAQQSPAPNGARCTHGRRVDHRRRRRRAHRHRNRTPTPQWSVVELASGARDPAQLTGAPAAIAAGEAGLWVAEPDVGALVRIDRSSRPCRPADPARGGRCGRCRRRSRVGRRAYPATSSPGSTPRPATRTQSIELGGAQVGALAYRSGHVWVADVTDHVLIELDATSGSELHDLRPAREADSARRRCPDDLDRRLRRRRS